MISHSSCYLHLSSNFINNFFHFMLLATKPLPYIMLNYRKQYAWLYTSIASKFVIYWFWVNVSMCIFSQVYWKNDIFARYTHVVFKVLYFYDIMWNINIQMREGKLNIPYELFILFFWSSTTSSPVHLHIRVEQSRGPRTIIDYLTLLSVTGMAGSPRSLKGILFIYK